MNACGRNEFGKIMQDLFTKIKKADTQRSIVYERKVFDTDGMVTVPGDLVMRWCVGINDVNVGF